MSRDQGPSRHTHHGIAPGMIETVTDYEFELQTRIVIFMAIICTSLVFAAGWYARDFFN